MIEPVDPLERRELDGIDAAPGSSLPNDFGLVQPNNRLGERVVVGVPDATDRRL
jgi:hypothetical protein